MKKLDKELYNLVEMDKEAYKENRDICRADIAEFEDAAYALQEQYMKEVTE